MHDDEIAQAFVFHGRLAIVEIDIGLVEIAIGKQRQQFRQPRLDEMDAGRFERLDKARGEPQRSEEHTSELQSLMRISYAVFCLKKKKITKYLISEEQIALHTTSRTKYAH